MSRMAWGLVVAGVAFAPVAWAGHHEHSKTEQKAEQTATEAAQPGAEARTSMEQEKGGTQQTEAGAARGGTPAERPSTAAPGIPTTESGKAERLGGAHPESTELIQKLYSQSTLDAETARLAKEKSQDEQVKQFADAVARDHKRLGERLEELAKGRGVELSKEAALSSGQKAHVEEMRAMSAAQFDDHFKQMMLEDHGKLLTDLKSALDEANRSGDRELVAVLQEARPKIEEHHAAAQGFGQAGSMGSTGTMEETRPGAGSAGAGEATPQPSKEAEQQPGERR